MLGLSTKLTLLGRVGLLALEALLALLAHLVEQGRRRIQRGDITLLKLEKQNDTGSAKTEPEEGEHVEAHQHVIEVPDLTDEVERLDQRHEREENRTRTHRDEGPLLVRQPVGDAQADVNEQQQQEGNREPTL